MDKKTIYVYLDNDIDKLFFGKLYVEYIKGKEVFSFEYSDELLSSKYNGYFFDTDLFPYKARQYLPLDKNIFGIFSDTMPDRWGRLLLNRKNKDKTLTEFDYLLGVNDKTRMGALRFSLLENGEYLSNDEQSVPPIEHIKDLEYAALQLENDDEYDDKWLLQLISPGSSLGGARGKANILESDNSLWIAKFPSKNDEYDVGLFEKVAYDLAKLCDINVMPNKLLKLSEYGHTLLVKRFDRINKTRIPFISFMTALGKKDGDDNTTYLDFISFLKSFGANVKNDLKELFKRIAFNIAISNTDDHLRNHGLLLTDNGWILSPLYDINPNPYGKHLSLFINETDSSLSYHTLLTVAKQFNIKDDEAKQIIDNISNIVINNWEKIASSFGASKKDIEYIRPAFKQKSSFNKPAI